MFLLKKQTKIFLHNKSVASGFPGHCFSYLGRKLKKKNYLCMDQNGRGD